MTHVKRIWPAPSLDQRADERAPGADRAAHGATIAPQQPARVGEAARLREDLARATPRFGFGKWPEAARARCGGQDLLWPRALVGDSACSLVRDEIIRIAAAQQSRATPGRTRL